MDSGKLRYMDAKEYKLREDKSAFALRLLRANLIKIMYDED